VGGGAADAGGGVCSGDDDDLVLDPPVFKISEPFIPRVEFVNERLTVLSSLELPL